MEKEKEQKIRRVDITRYRVAGLRWCRCRFLRRPASTSCGPGSRDSTTWGTWCCVPGSRI